jgi:ribokinase
MAKIVVVGSINTDLVVRVSRFPQPGETLAGNGFFTFNGGKGANQAVGAARFGASVTLVSRVGADQFGQQTRSNFLAEKIDTAYMVTDPEHPSGVALITVDGAGQNAIVVAPGANAHLSATDVDRAEKALMAADMVLTQLETPLDTLVHLCAKLRALGKRLVLNPAPVVALPAEVYEQLYLITPNETEATLLTGIEVTDEASAQRAADILLSQGVQQVIITLGARGAFYSNGTDSWLTQAPKVTPVDTTAAGDIFNGCLTVALAEGQPMRSAMQLACTAAALSVTRMGAQASAPYRAEV